MTSFSDASTSLAKLFRQAGSDPSIIATSDFKLDVGIQLGIINVVGEKMLALTPPAKFRDTHVHMVQAASKMTQLAKTCAEAVDEISQEKMARCGELSLEINGHLNDGTEALKAIQ